MPLKKTKRGMLWVNRVGARRSEAILARNFFYKNRDGQKKKETKGLWKVTPLMEIAHRG
jgi:hypothetical protein